mgnify:CR=1 FL=1
MYCPDPNCRCQDSRVLLSKGQGNGFTVERKRECLSCSNRFTTYEFNSSDLINPMEMTKFYRFISIKATNESPSKTDQLERKEFYKLAKTKNFYPFTINLKKLIVNLSEQEKIIIKIKFFEKSTTAEASSWLGISKESVRSAELKALKFLRTLWRDDAK